MTACEFGVAGCNPKTCNGHLGQAHADTLEDCRARTRHASLGG